MADDVRILASGLGFPEGPVAMADGSVILTEIRNRRCARVTADGKASVFSDNGGGPNGLAVGPDGSMITCLMSPVMRPNGCGLAPDGKIPYVADPVTARLYAYDIGAPGVLAKTKADFAHTGRVVGGAPAGPAGFDSLAVLANGN